MRRAFPHQIRQIEHLILPKLRDIRLLRREILRLQDIFIPPFVAGRRAQHTPHKMIMPIRMGEGMQRVILVYTERLA